MKCPICKQRIVQATTINTFFSRFSMEICDKCSKKNMRTESEYWVIPIENYSLHVHILGKNIEDEKTVLIPYLRKAVQIYSQSTGSCDMILIIIDMIDDEIIKCLDLINLSDIILITIKYKGEISYEI